MKEMVKSHIVMVIDLQEYLGTLWIHASHTMLGRGESIGYTQITLWRDDIKYIIPSNYAVNEKCRMIQIRSNGDVELMTNMIAMELLSIIDMITWDF